MDGDLGADNLETRNPHGNCLWDAVAMDIHSRNVTFPNGTVRTRKDVVSEAEWVEISSIDGIHTMCYTATATICLGVEMGTCEESQVASSG